MKLAFREMKNITLMGTLCLAWTSSALAQHFVDDERGPDGAESLEEAFGRYSEAVDRRRVKTPFEKMHRKTLLEFVPVVERARQSTVKVYKGDYVKVLGTVVAQEGLIITKASEIEDDTDLAVELPNREKKVAELIEVDTENDLALLWVRDFNLTPVKWAPGRELPVGSLLATPGSFKMPVAIGAVSLPLRNLSESDKGFLGVELEATEDGAGVSVIKVVEDSGADAAGIEAGDVIRAVDGQAMKTTHDLINTISGAEPGDIVVVQLLRGEEAMILEVTLGDLNSGRAFSMPKHEMLDNTARMGGRVSRKRSGYLAAIQHDMLLKPNQCGGPLVNLDGDVIGVNIARASRVKTYAIPSEVIQEWLGDPRELAASVLQARVKNAEAARLAAEESLQEALDVEVEMRATLRELEEHRASSSPALLDEPPLPLEEEEGEGVPELEPAAEGQEDPGI